MITTSTSLGTLIDRCLLDVESVAEVPLAVVLASGGTTAASSDVSWTLVDADAVNISDVLEFGSELVQVTAKTADAVPVLTVQRGYYNTTKAAHTVADVGYVNPQFPRARVAEAIRRSFARLEALGVPSVTSGVFNPATDVTYVEMPAACRQVYSVRYMSEEGHLFDIDRWRFQDDLPTTAYATGKILSLGWYVSETDDLIVTYRTPYRWSTYPANPTEAATISILEGAEDLPAIYAAAWLASRRELSRLQIARSQEWNDGEPIRNGVSQSLVRVLWQQFYQSLDEARRLYQAPVYRPYRKTARL